MTSCISLMFFNKLHAAIKTYLLEQYQKIYLYKRIVQAKLFIDKQYAENIDLDNIADEANFSKFHFIRLFKSIYGKTPHHYLIKVRIDNAKSLLLKQLSISDVCYSVGFTSITSFTALFKKMTGVTPAAFQQHQLKRNTEMQTNPLHFIPNCFSEKFGWAKKAIFNKAD